MHGLVLGFVMGRFIVFHIGYYNVDMLVFVSSPLSSS